MKLNAIFYGGRKKDFWDLHYLLYDAGLDLQELIRMHNKRFPYEHEDSQIMEMLVNWEKADDEPDPICIMGKYWDLIKLDIKDKVDEIKL